MAEWNERAPNGEAMDERGDGPAQLEAMLDRARAELDTYTEAASSFIRERPVMAVAGALALGFLVGKLVSRR